MKKIGLLILLIIPLIAGVIIVKNFNSTQSPASSPQPALGVSEEGSQVLQIKIDGEVYNYDFVKVDLENLRLLPNYSLKLGSSVVQEKSGCQNLVSAGFYLTDNSPAGMVVSDGVELNKWSVNSLFNGVLSVNDMLTPRITKNPPRDHLKLAVQAGPVLIENGISQSWKSSTDKYARRVLAAVDGDNKLYFLVVYSADQVFSGPRLQELPQVLEEVQKSTGLILADALNLDGGSASVFISGNTSLSEITPVGSFFCW